MALCRGKKTIQFDHPQICPKLFSAPCQKIVPCRNKYLASFQTIADPFIPSNSELLTNSRSLNAARFGGDKLIDKAF